MKYYLHILLAALLFTFNKGYSQADYPKDYFRAPVDIRMLLSGTFGELRSNHFHSGIDIKTNGKGGEEIYAIAEGYVSRIKISAFGFGKTLYITHPNGYVSVYAHLDRFNNKLAAYTKEQHYQKESFELNIFPDKGLLPVKKGEIIGYSGNSGYSFGPHLHFEIRDEATQEPLNPLYFGIEVKDFIRPKMISLTVYPANPEVKVNGEKSAYTYKLEGWGEEYRLPDHDTITVTGPVFFGIETYDLLNDASNKNGVYSIELLKDDTIVFSFVADKFSFNETRYINSMIDYGFYTDHSRRIIRSKVDPNNRLSMYNMEGKGIVMLSGEKVNDLSYTVKDIVGNTSMLDFKVAMDDSGGGPAYAVSAPPGKGSFFFYDKPNYYETTEMKLEVPKGAIYDSFLFEYDTLPAKEEGLSRVHGVHLPTTPLHKYCTLSIRPAQKIPEGLEQKSLLVKIDEKGEMNSAGGEYQDGFVKARIRDFGNYMVTLDTVSPEIIPLRNASMKNIGGKNRVGFKIKDDLSGIKEYRGELNGEWILMEYDAKNDLLFYDVDERMKKGVGNTFKLVITDMKGNEARFETVWTK